MSERQHKERSGSHVRAQLSRLTEHERREKEDDDADCRRLTRGPALPAQPVDSETKQNPHADGDQALEQVVAKGCQHPEVQQLRIAGEVAVRHFSHRNVGGSECGVLQPVDGHGQVIDQGIIVARRLGQRGNEECCCQPENENEWDRNWAFDQSLAAAAPSVAPPRWHGEREPRPTNARQVQRRRRRARSPGP